MKKIFILILAVSLFSRTANAQVIQSDFDALVALYNATGGDNWTNNSGWSTTTNNVSNSWAGITVTGDRVTEIFFQSNNLVGYLPVEIGNLTALQSLYLNFNKLTSIPAEIGNLTLLTNLSVDYNLLTYIPAEIGSLINLTHLDLGNNDITSIPTEIGLLNGLTTLYLNGNRLSSIPTELYNCTMLEKLNLGSNSITSIPAQVENLTVLKYLWLWQNRLTDLPDEIGNLSELLTLDLTHNQLTSIPLSVCNISSLNTLEVDWNDLSNVPKEIGDLTALTTLLLGHNQLTNIPSEISNLTTLTKLELYSNQLSAIPDISTLTALSYLRLDDNQLTQVPTAVGGLTNLVDLRLNINKFASLPDLSTLINLDVLYVEDNLLDFADLDAANLNWANILNGIYAPQAKITLSRAEANGQITFSITMSGSNNQYKWFKDNVEIVGATLNTFTVADNENGLYYCEITNSNYPLLTLVSTTEGIGLINGVVKEDYDALVALYDATGGATDWRNNTNWKSSEPVETWYGLTVVDSRVTQIDLEYNNLTGAIPPEISGLTALEELRVGNNQIKSIPVEIGSFPVMIRLWLEDNLLTEIPAEIGNLSALQSLDLSQNQLASLPAEIGNLSELVSLNLWGNQLSTIPSTLGNLTKLTSVYLYSNQLTSLPSEIGSWISVRYLRLNDNQLSTILPEITNMTMLTDLRLNNNKLSSLPNLSALTRLYNFPIENNYLDFGDLETVNVNWTNITYSSYSPQADVLIDLTENTNDYTLTVTVDGTNNAYKWYKDDVEVTGETTNSIVISKTAGTSVYYCEITDTNFPDLTLSSKTIFLPAGVSKAEYDALVAIYNATGGDNWTDNTNWLSGSPVNDWYGVDVAQNKLMVLDLSNNNLSGNIPAEIGDLYALSTLNFDDNTLSGTIPQQIGNLPGLFMLGLNNNSFSGTIPSSLSYLSKLNYLGLSGNQLGGIVPSELSKMNNLGNLILFDNQLTDLPDLSAFQNIEIISVAENQLTFEDIEPNLGVASLEFSYSPQARVGEAETHYLANGDNDTLIISVGGEHNVYKWYKDGSPVSGSDNDSLFIENFSAADAGEYYCEITNTVATALTLHSDTITLLEAYSAKFTVSDRNGALSNANVAVTGYESKTTDAQGVAVFKITPANGVSFSVSTANHDNYTGAFNIVDKDEQIDVVMVVTGIDDINKTNIQVYPNPSNGQFTLDVGDLQIKNTYLKILDINGRLVYREKLNAAKTQINIPANHQGLSIIQVSDDENVYLKEKIFIVR